jgi:hypothetical protein
VPSFYVVADRLKARVSKSAAVGKHAEPAAPLVEPPHS